MAKKYSETDLTTWTVSQLKKRATGLHCSVYQSDCFSTHDLVELMAVEAELNRRGYEFSESKTLEIVKA